MLLWKKEIQKWWPRNGCNGRLKAKILITTIQVNLVLNRSETWRRQHKFTWIVVIKIFAFSLPSQPFLGHHFGDHIFFYNTILEGHTLFLQLGCFGLDTLLTSVCTYLCLRINKHGISLCCDRSSTKYRPWQLEWSFRWSADHIVGILQNNVKMGKTQGVLLIIFNQILYNTCIQPIHTYIQKK